MIPLPYYLGSTLWPVLTLRHHKVFLLHSCGTFPHTCRASGCPMGTKTKTPVLRQDPLFRQAKQSTLSIYFI